MATVSLLEEVSVTATAADDDVELEGASSAPGSWADESHSHSDGFTLLTT